MKKLNIEIKAKTDSPQKIRDVLNSEKAEFLGIDYQIDTYFKVNSGRLKLREGNIENSLVHYNRENQKGPKQSDVTLFKTSKGSSLKDILLGSLGRLVVVDKQREIYFIDNVKFHIDKVKYLGDFIEIEAIDNNGDIGRDKLFQQCNYYIDLFGINEEDLISKSYSDLLLKRT